MRLLFGLLILCWGCAPNGPTENTDSLPTDQSPSQVRTEQEERTAAFGSLVGRGVVEFRWEDEKGSHKEQGDLDFWKKGAAISLRISKFGEPLMWFGGDNDSHWLFDMMDDGTILTINGDNAIFSDIDVALVLMGLTPLPAGTMEVHNGVVSLTDEQGRLWTATFDPTTHRPLEMKIEDGDNQTMSFHREGIRVEILNQHELYWPFTGGLIDLEDSQGATKVKIVFSSLSTIVDEEPMDRVFSLSFLQKALKPSTTIQGGKE